MPVQVKLLDVLHDRTFSRVGDNTVRRFKGRVIAATNRPLAEMRYEGNFRDDFFYRLTSNVVQLPSLRQRIDESPEEFVLLVSSLVSRTTEDADGELTALVLNALENQLPDDYPWPGNVRELEQVVRSVLMAGKYMGNPLEGETEPEVALARRLRSGELTAEALLSNYCALLYGRVGTYEGVAQRTGFDRRTVKSYVEKDRQRNED